MANLTLRRHRNWLIWTSALLFSLLLSRVAFADTDTNLGRDRFTIEESSSTVAYFSIIDGDECRDKDYHCTVKVTSNKAIANHPGIINTPTPAATASPTHTPTATPTAVAGTNDSQWKRVFEAICGSGTNAISSGSVGSQNRAFNNCWEQNRVNGYSFDVEWPIIKLDRSEYKFNITPHCDDNDDECAVALGICYNPEDCRHGSDVDEARDSDRASSDVSEFWEDINSCVYDDDDDDVWKCINEEFQDWLEDELSSNDDYDDLIDELERSRHDDLGISVLDYDDDLRDVYDTRSRTSTKETLLERYQRKWRTTAATSIYRAQSEVEEGSYNFKPSQDDYLIVNLTSYLDLESPIQVCNTPIGCFMLTGRSDFFRQYMKSFFLVITDRKVTRCMDNRGWDTDDDHVIPFNHPDLIACDTRIKTAVQHCPAENVGARHILFSLYDTGLLNGVVTPASAQQWRQELEQARVRAPDCLCAAGFQVKSMAISSTRSNNPWEYSGGARLPRELCDD